MKIIFLDINVVIDLLAKREPFYVEAVAIFTLACRRKVTLYGETPKNLNILRYL